MKTTKPVWDRLEVALPWLSFLGNTSLPMKIDLYNSDRRYGNHKLIGSVSMTVGDLISVHDEQKTFLIVKDGRRTGRIHVLASFLAGTS